MLSKKDEYTLYLLRFPDTAHIAHTYLAYCIGECPNVRFIQTHVVQTNKQKRRTKNISDIVIIWGKLQKISTSNNLAIFMGNHLITYI